MIESGAVMLIAIPLVLLGLITGGVVYTRRLEDEQDPSVCPHTEADFSPVLDVYVCRACGKHFTDWRP